MREQWGVKFQPVCVFLPVEENTRPYMIHTHKPFTDPTQSMYLGPYASEACYRKPWCEQIFYYQRGNETKSTIRSPFDYSRWFEFVLNSSKPPKSRHNYSRLSRSFSLRRALVQQTYRPRNYLAVSLLGAIHGGSFYNIQTHSLGEVNRGDVERESELTRIHLMQLQHCAYTWNTWTFQRD